MKWLALPLLALTLAACSSAPKKSPSPAAQAKDIPQAQAHVPDASCIGKYKPAQEDPGTRGNYKAGGLYAPGVADTTPDYVPDVDCIAEPIVTNELPSKVGNRSPYSVLGKQYEVMQRVEGYVEQGTASYYGKKFHGRRTSNQEVYDMYAFTAAHKTLPLPSFARVTNLDNGKSVVVRVNDRGPFHEGRVIDLSYAAAVKLGITQRGTGRVEVRALTSKDQGQYVAVATPRATRPSNSQPTAMDALVGNLPKAQAAVPSPGATQPQAASVAAKVAAPLVDPTDPGRYRIVADTSKPASADRFDAWLKARNLMVVGGKIVPMGTAVPASAQAVPTNMTNTPPRTVAAAPQPMRTTPASGLVWLQVASYSSRENADRALERLTAAGISGASLSDVESNGRTFWRLRVGAPDQATASELAGRIAGLGLGQPQVVRN
jgi:rare lipoprotein A